MGSNGLSYTLHGNYYLSDLVVNEEEPTYGKYGMLREYYGAAEPPVRCGEIHLSGLTEPPHFVY